MMAVKFPIYEDELIKLDIEDQAEIRNHYSEIKKLKSETEKEQLNKMLALHCHNRAHRMIEILSIVQLPTISNIGLEGSKAVSLLSLHAYLNLMKKTLALYEREFKKDPKNIYYQAIPPLKDRIMILEYREQLFGTNWCIDKHGNFFLIKVKNFEKLNQRRAELGLKPAKRPVILSYGAKKYPLGKGKVQESDQKDMTDGEYAEYSKYQLKNLVK